MKEFCQRCGGTGKIMDQTSRPDVCDVCMGLGFVNVEGIQEGFEKKKRSRRFYVFLSIAAVLLGLYYVGLYLAVTKFGLTLLVTMVFFVGGHAAIFGGFLMYMLVKIMKNNH